MNQQRFFYFGCLLACWWTGVGGGIRFANAGELIVVSQPASGPMGSSLIAEIDCRWTEGWGYRPVTVTLRTVKSNADRTIRVVLIPADGVRGGQSLRAGIDIEIPAGQKIAADTLYVPQRYSWEWMQVEMYEDGRQLTGDANRQYPCDATMHAVDFPCLLFVDSDAPAIAERKQQLASPLLAREYANETLPDMTKLGFLTSNVRNSVPDNSNSPVQREPDWVMLQVAELASNIELIPPASLPVRHLGLSGIDVICMGLEEFDELLGRDAARFTAVQQWVQLGGNLVLYGDRDADRDPFSRAASTLGITRDWKEADASFCLAEVKSWQELCTQPGPFTALSNAKLSHPPFRTVSYGMGRVAVIQSEDPFRNGPSFWQWVLRSIGIHRLLWANRHGFSPVNRNDDFWDFLVPGFGAAPVKTFLATICLFVLTIGPINFILLKRWRRLYLLPVTIGLAALLTTGAMMVFALVSDGVSTQVRLRSYTQIDQQKGVAITYCRQAYVAAFVPSEGLVFPDTTCVYPLLAVPDASRRCEEYQSNRTETRALQRGYLPSRSTSQFVTANIEQTRKGLILDKTASANPAIINQLEVPIEYVWIHDAEGKLYAVQKLAIDAKQTTTASDHIMAKGVLSEWLAKHRPSSPAGLAGQLDQMMLTTGRSIARSYGPMLRPPQMSRSLLEQHLLSAHEFFDRAQPNSYLVITTVAPSFVKVGTSATETVGLHLIEGQW